MGLLIVNMKLILASSSPRRKELLEKAGYRFVIQPAEIDETFDEQHSPIENVLRVSRLKANSIYALYPDDVILACDTIVVYEGRVYGKPVDELDAFGMLKTFSNHKHQVISGVSIISKTEQFNFYVESKVTFKNLSDEEIKSYISSKEPFGKAGSYAIQGLGGKLVKEFEGELENIIGLPITEIVSILDKYEL